MKINICSRTALLLLKKKIGQYLTSIDLFLLKPSWTIENYLAALEARYAALALAIAAASSSLATLAASLALEI